MRVQKQKKRERREGLNEWMGYIVTTKEDPNTADAVSDVAVVKLLLSLSNWKTFVLSLPIQRQEEGSIRG